MRPRIWFPIKTVRSALAHVLAIVLVLGIAGVVVRSLVDPAATSERSAAGSTSRGIGESLPTVPAEVPRPGPLTNSDSSGDANADDESSQADSQALLLANAAVPLPSRLGVPEVDEGPVPVRMEFEDVDASADIIAAGVDDAGEFDVPPASQIGWYRFGPAPGQDGSAVLAAHIAFNGRDGVFRYLDEAEVGDRFTIEFSDGSASEFEVTETAQYAKDDLPSERVFARSGSPSVALITCGGAFDSAESSYEDNVVVYAEPVR
ncbi:MAG: class F sortase [Acidimicrobiales bacterium]|nr:class F sortase [Acidimicrobiales bacterium]